MAAAIASRGGEDATTAATSVAALNGFTIGSNGITVTVTNPYSGCGGSSNCVKVAISQAQTTYSLRVLGYNSFTVSASAAGGVTNSTTCLYALSSSAGDLTISGGSGTS